MPPWKMYSGYVTYTSPMQKSQHSTFVWIAEAQDVDPTTAPLGFWSNGGVRRLLSLLSCRSDFFFNTVS